MTHVFRHFIVTSQGVCLHICLRGISNKIGKKYLIPLDRQRLRGSGGRGGQGSGPLQSQNYRLS